MQTDTVAVFTNREIEVLDLLVKGFSNKRIAETLLITDHTVKAHLESIYDKLKVNNRVQASIKYLEFKGMIKTI